jgi:hypothetical protein
MKTSGNYFNNRRRGIQDTTFGNRTTNWVSRGGGQDCKNKYIGWNCRAISRYKTIGCYVG